MCKIEKNAVKVPIEGHRQRDRYASHDGIRNQRKQQKDRGRHLVDHPSHISGFSPLPSLGLLLLLLTSL